MRRFADKPQINGIDGVAVDLEAGRGMFLILVPCTSGYHHRHGHLGELNINESRHKAGSLSDRRDRLARDQRRDRPRLAGVPLGRGNKCEVRPLGPKSARPESETTRMERAVDGHGDSRRFYYGQNFGSRVVYDKPEFLNHPIAQLRRARPSSSVVDQWASRRHGSSAPLMAAVCATRLV